MTLGQDILRLITVRALRDRTWVGARVYDSPATPADLMLGRDRAPFIAVYTDDADHELEGQSFHNPTSALYLLIECAAATRVTIAARPGGNAPSSPPAAASAVSLVQTDEGLELIIGCIARQVIQALMATDSEWAELWRLFATIRTRVEVRRGGPGQDSEQSGIRYASRIMRMEIMPIADPVYGEGVPSGFWTRFFTAAEADPELSKVAPMLRGHFESTPRLPSWRVEQMRGTYTFEALKSLGITPLDPVIGDEAEAPELTRAEPDQVDWRA